MAAGLSIREFARRENCSDTLVRRAIKQSRIKTLDDGSIDPSLVGSAWRQGNATGANSANTGANTVRTPARPVRTAPADAALPVHGPGDDETLKEAAERILADIEGVDYAEALRRKENYLALLRQLEYEQKSGALVELTIAQGVLFEAFRGQRDAWLNWPVKVGPLLAAELGIEEADRVVEALTAHVHKQITDLGEPAADFATGET